MSSLKDLASLIMIPSLYKDGELHTVKPLADENVIIHPDATDNNDGDDGSTPTTSSNFTFSRGSNLAATRVCLLYTSPSPRDRQKSRMPSSA